MPRHLQRAASSCAGFTLIELVAALVLLGLLAAVAVPKYFDLQDEANRTVCQSRRSALVQEVRHTWAHDLVSSGLDQSTEKPNEYWKKVFTTVYDELKHSSSYRCPSSDREFGFVYISQSLGFTVTCPHLAHGGKNNLGVPETMQAVVNAFNAFGHNRVDSTDVATAQKLESLLGMSFAELGVPAWSMQNKNNNFLYWTPFPIDGYANGTKVPVMRYNTKTGTYTVWRAEIETVNGHKTFKVFDNSDPYNILTPDKTLQRYDDAVSAMGAAIETQYQHLPMDWQRSA